MKNIKKIILDAYNVLPHIPNIKRDSGSSLEDSRETLIKFMIKWKRESSCNDEILIVFDGTDEFIHKIENKYGVSYTFSSLNEEADGYIVSIVRNAKNTEDITVITNDQKHIGHICRSLGAKVLHPRTLLDIPKSRYTEDDKKLNRATKDKINEELKKEWGI